MRIAAITAALLFAGAAPALATPASVEVKLGPALQAKAAKTYGLSETQDLARELRQTVEARLTRTGAYDGARIELTLVDAIPNRPTMKQMSDKPGLSFQSFGVGGAKIEGRAVAPDGTVTPLAYRWYETDITWERGRGVWGDAEAAFQGFANSLTRGPALASR